MTGMKTMTLVLGVAIKSLNILRYERDNLVSYFLGEGEPFVFLLP